MATKLEAVKALELGKIMSEYSRILNEWAIKNKQHTALFWTANTTSIMLEGIANRLISAVEKSNEV